MNPGLLKVVKNAAYGEKFAPPATMAPSRPAINTINFFIATTPTLFDSPKAAQRTPLVFTTLPP